MAYKDKDKQREANKQASQRRRDKAKGMTQQGMTVIDEPSNVIPEQALDRCRKRLAKRGKEIKCFEDLHPEIQAIINRLSTDKDGNIDQQEHGRRTAIAIHYQHLYPDRYEPHSDLEFTSLMATAGPSYARVSKPGDPDYDGVCTPEWIAERNTG